MTSPHPLPAVAVAPSVARARVAVLGASGYGGGELLSLLIGHPGVEVAIASAHSLAGREIAAVHPTLRGRMEGTFDPFDPELASACDIVLVALPGGESMAVVPQLLAGGARVVDLGGDFRFDDPAEYGEAYGRPHGAPELLESAVYGLVELNRPAIAGARLVASPGCYPTATLLPLLPLLREGLIEPTGVAVTAMSGTTGAGRSGEAALSMSEMHGNARSYRVGRHQHAPEIAHAARILAGVDLELTFVPHLLPVARGILATSVAAPAEGVGIDKMTEALVECYRDEPLVRILDGEELPELRAVVGRSHIEIALRLDRRSGRIVLLSAIDNLRKGAASQGIQSMNLMLGHPETLSLL